MCLYGGMGGGGGGVAQKDSRANSIPLKHKHTMVPYLLLPGPAGTSQHAQRQLLSKSTQTTHSAEGCKQCSRTSVEGHVGTQSVPW